MEVWKSARVFRNLVSELVKKFPNEEKFRLTDQIIRSSRSVTSNIAEGFGRFHHQENIQFCRQARGSLVETLDHLICAYDEKFINKTQFDEFKKINLECQRILNGYILYLKKAKENEKIIVSKFTSKENNSITNNSIT
jgi:four helix bundle protein